MVITRLKPSYKFSFAEKDSVLIVYREFSFPISIIYYQMQTNIQKKILRGRKKTLFVGRSLATELQGWKWLYFTKFDSVTKKLCQEIKIGIGVKFIMSLFLFLCG